MPPRDYTGTMLATIVEMEVAHAFDEICLKHGMSINQALSAYVYNCVKTDSLAREGGSNKKCRSKTK